MTYVENKRKELKTIWPITEGTTAGTTKQTGDKYLHAEGLNGLKTTVLKRENVGLGD